MFWRRGHCQKRQSFLKPNPCTSSLLSFSYLENVEGQPETQRDSERAAFLYQFSEGFSGSLVLLMQFVILANFMHLVFR